MRTRTPPSPAAIALAVAGATQADVADVMGATRAAVSHWLAGRRSAPDNLAPALEQLLGPDRAAHVLAQIDDRQEAMAA